ncbi:Reverse transcriptase domain [Arabidopsis suecica]|uniref:Reverse transcriptase domain n=1 Tax=Arabidopsis suecica TaxID=45249 RepID=A0A8T1XBY2_ARASU|nr:Reverse transcriptase domain [Arabidopsis suecica]
MFANQLDKTMEVYIDDMLVKSAHEKDHVPQLRECFKIVNKFEMKLNPEKCSFGVPSGEFLGYLVTERGIEANPKQIAAFIEMPSPKTAREVQRLTGCIAALNRFISRSADKCVPFYQLLRKDKKFDWNDDCEQAFKQLKAYRSELPILAKPQRRGTIVPVHGSLLNRDKQRPEYRTRTSLKAHVLADFVIELPLADLDGTNSNKKWLLHVDGSSNRQASRLAQGMGIRDIHAHSDSQLVTSQFHGEYEAKDECMEAYLELVKTLTQQFESFELTRIRRGENTSAYVAALASTTTAAARALAEAAEASVAEGEPKLENPKHPSIDLTVKHAGMETSATCNFTRVTRSTTAAARALAAAAEASVAEGEPELETPEQPALYEPKMYNDWRILIIDYIERGITPPDKWEARKLKAQSARYCITERRLMKRRIAGPYMVCTYGQQTKDLMKSMHEGQCGSHCSGRTLALRIKKQGYFWPTMLADCIAHSLRSHGSLRWEEETKNLLVLTDYSTKLIEAKAFQQVTEKQVEDFLWENIVCRHGIPYEIVTDNGTNLTSGKIKEFCDKWKIRLTTSTPSYPQEAVILVETIVPSVRRTASPANSDLNTQMLQDNMDFIDERRDQAMIRLQNYQQAAARYYNSNINIRRFEVGELVLRKVFSNTRELNAGKLGTNWDGPYRITEVVRDGVYKLVKVINGVPELRAWNAMHLKKYHE